jgi:hypothetical protein
MEIVSAVIISFDIKPASQSPKGFNLSGHSSMSRFNFDKVISHLYDTDRDRHRAD